MASVLVLGGTGFIGSHLVESLIKQGHSVTSYSKLKNPPFHNLKDIKHSLSIIDADYFDLDQLEHAISQSEYVFHMGTFGSPAEASEIERNFQNTLQLITLCSKHNIRKLIYPSSGGTVYGNQIAHRLSEETPTEPISLYGRSKIRIEQHLADLHATGQLESLIFRISNPFGPRQSPFRKQGLIPISLQRIKEGYPIEIFGDGTAVRDYIYITDVTELLASVFDKPTEHRVYNLGSGHGYSINDILDIYRKDFGLSFDTIYHPARSADVLRVVLDTTRIEDEFGFEPKVCLVQGIRLTLEYILEINAEISRIKPR